MKVRKIVSVILMTAMLFFAPSMIPRSGAGPSVTFPCGAIPTGWLPTDTAFAAVVTTPCPAAVAGSHTLAWFWVAFACPASIIVSGAVANFRDNRQLTTWEAWTCGLAFWLAKPASQQKPPR
jgi:hypothetical protein